MRLLALNDAQLKLTLFAAEPDILTPIGLAIDKRGRLFVVESHTPVDSSAEVRFLRQNPRQNSPPTNRPRLHPAGLSTHSFLDCGITGTSLVRELESAEVKTLR